MIFLTIGIPASGKSTWAKEQSNNNPDIRRACRDDLRLMLGGTQMMDGPGEYLVTKLVEHAIANKGKSNIIVDQTNCNIKYLNKLIDFATSFDNVKLVDFPVELNEAIVRDSKRVAGKVGEDVIKRMHKGYEEVKASFNFESLIFKKDYKVVVANKPSNVTAKLPKAVIFDIDGTLAHMENKRRPFEWNKVGVDSLDNEVSELIDMYINFNYRIILLSGRDGICRPETEEWLIKNGVCYDSLFMRSVNDNRNDGIIKQELYENNIKPYFDVKVIYDDRDRVVKMWRSLGLKCFQVAEGDF